MLMQYFFFERIVIMNKKLMILLFCILAPSVFAGVLLTDDFESGSLDSARYPDSGGKIGDVEQAGGELIFTPVDGAEVFPRIGTKDSFPDNVEVSADIRIIDAAPASGTWEANTGFRTGCSGFDSNGTTAEIFTSFEGSASPDKIRSRLGGPWTEYGISDFSSDITNGQVVTMTQVLNVVGGTNDITVTDKDSGVTLATLSVTPSGAPSGGSLMLQTYYMSSVGYQNITITENGGSGSILFQDDFESPGIDPAKWLTYPNTVSFVSVQDGAAVINGDDINNGAGDFAYLPTKQVFEDFEMQAEFTLADLNSAAGEREGEDFFGVRFRETNVADAYYQLAIWPNTGEDVDGTGVASPAIALRKADSLTTFTYLAGPYPIARPAAGDSLVVNLKAEGENLTAYIGPDAETSQWPVLTATDSEFSNGVIDFNSNGIVGIELEEYTVWDVGTGELAPEPQPPASAHSIWNRYE